MTPIEQVAIQNAREKLIFFSLLYDKNYTVNWHHREIAKALEKVESGEIKRLIIEMPPRHGKLLADSTPVLTTNGWKTHGTLLKGDFVFGLDGKPKKVIAVSKTDCADNEIEFSNGEKIKAHNKHEWLIFDRSLNEERIVETEWLLKRKLITGEKKPRCTYQIPRRCKLETEEKNLPINPYFLGVWLGDGRSSQVDFCFADKDEAILSSIEKMCIVHSWKTKHSTTGVNYVGFKGLKSAFRKLGLIDNKHIPNIYLMSSEAQRLELLAGLIDTDGSLEKKTGRIRIVTCSIRLKDDIVELIQSLGWFPYITQQQPCMSSSGIIGKQIVYTIGFQADRKIPTRIIRKQNTVFNSLVKKIGIKSIKKCKPEIGRCIQVEGGVYLVGKKLIPTHNSLLASIYFPAWYLGRNPDKEIITASYNQDLARDFGSKTRDIVSDPQYRAVFPIELKSDTQSKDKWKTDKGGSYTSVGVGGSLTGRGAHVLLIDDPFKNREEAESDIIRNKVWDWFTSTAYTRLEKGGAIIVIMTRWHNDDLVGRLIEHEKIGGEKWDRISFPAIAEVTEPRRAFGEALWPDKYDVEALDRIKSTIGIYDWSSLYQQKPVNSEAQEFKKEYFRYFSDEDIKDKYLIYTTTVDPAISQQKIADDTVILTVGKEPNGPNWYIVDIVSGHLDPFQTVNAIFQQQAKYNSNVFIETVAYQQALKYFVEEEQRKRQQYFLVGEIRSKRANKETRIRGLLPMFRVGVIKQRPTDKKLEDQLLVFPFGAHDDIIDALAMQLEAVQPTFQQTTSIHHTYDDLDSPI